MITLNKVDITNFRLIQKATIHLKDLRGTLFISGENKDVPSANSNMSGKSTIIHSVTYALYGCDASGKKLTDDAITDGCNSCEVSLTLYDKETSIRYVVSRTRERGRGSIPAITIYKKATGVSDKKQGTSCEELIESVFGHRDLFLASHVFSCGADVESFCAASDSEQKRLFDLLLDANDLEIAKANADKALLEQSKAVSDLTIDTARCDAVLNNSKQEMTRLKLRAKEQQAAINASKDRAKKVNRVLAYIKQLTAAYTKKLSSQINRRQEYYESARKKINAAEIIWNKKNAECLYLSKRIQQLTQLFESNEALCPTCGSAINKKELKLVIDNLNKQLKKKTRIRQKQQKLVDSLNTIRANIIKNADAIIQATDNKINRNSRIMEKLDRELAIAKAAEATAKNTLAKQKAEIQSRIRASFSDLLRLKLRQVKEQLKLNNIDFWRTAFGPKGIRVFRLEKIIPYLNSIANFYSQILFGDGTAIEYNALTKLKTGGFSERFSVSVLKPDGIKYSAISSGQAQRRDAVHILTMSHLARTLNSKTYIGFIVFDEAFRSLDEKGIDAIAQILAELKKDVPNILIVEHSEDIKDRFDHTIVVTRESGKSLVSVVD